MENNELLTKMMIPTKYQNFIDGNHFKIAEKNNELYFTNLSPEIKYQLYCSEFIGYEYQSINEISYTNLMYNTDHPNRCNEYANGFLNSNEYDGTDVDDVEDFICYLANKYDEYKFSKYTSLEEIDQNINILAFCHIYNKINAQKEIAYTIDGVTYTGILKEMFVNKTFLGLKLYISLQMLVNRSRQSYIMTRRIEIPFMSTIKSLEDIENLTILTDEEKVKYRSRGEKYYSHTIKPSYCIGKGYGWCYGGWLGDTRIYINSRLIIDYDIFRISNPDIDDDWYGGIENSVEISNVPKDMYWMFIPEIYGFTFDNKKWAKFCIEDIEEIEFAENSFNELIAPEKYKNVLLSTLNIDKLPSFDNISGKGNGRIFLLYGSAGTGKTLTAESVAEYLHRPLYFVSVGELGTTPEALEKSLENVMRIVTSWNAILLFDEVDVFVSKRDSMNIERNAMTAIFLRLLERFDGVMFMTTNLVNNLDEAFISRCTAMIKYANLTLASKAAIWKNLLSKVTDMKIDPKVYDNLDKLSDRSGNGRIIKNSLRLAYALAYNRNEKIILYDDILDILTMNTLN